MRPTPGSLASPDSRHAAKACGCFIARGVAGRHGIHGLLRWTGSVARVGTLSRWAGVGACRSQRRARRRGTLESEMTAKEQLRAVVERLDEDQAAEALEFIVGRHEQAEDPFLTGVPLDDELEAHEERAAVAEAEEAIARGDTVDLDTARAELE